MVFHPNIANISSFAAWEAELEVQHAQTAEQIKERKKHLYNRHASEPSYHPSEDPAHTATHNIVEQEEIRQIQKIELRRDSRSDVLQGLQSKA